MKRLIKSDVNSDLLPYAIIVSEDIGDAENGPIVVDDIADIIYAESEESAIKIWEAKSNNIDDFIGYYARIATKADFDEIDGYEAQYL